MPCAPIPTQMQAQQEAWENPTLRVLDEANLPTLYIRPPNSTTEQEQMELFKSTKLKYIIVTFLET